MTVFEFLHEHFWALWWLALLVSVFWSDKK